MSSVSITYPEAEIARTFAVIGERAPYALSRAMNRGVVSARTVMAREIADDTALGVRTVTKELKTKDSTPDTLRARLSVSGKKIPLIEWKPSVSTRNGVRAKLPPPGKGQYPHAFRATMPNGKIGIFSRTEHTRGAKVFGRRGDPKLERIDQLHGPALPSVFRKMSQRALDAGTDSMMKNLEHEIQYELSKA